MKNTFVLFVLMFSALFCLKAQSQSNEHQSDNQDGDLMIASKLQNENEYSNLTLLSGYHSLMAETGTLQNIDSEPLEFKGLTMLPTIDIDVKETSVLEAEPTSNSSEKMNIRIEQNAWNSNALLKTDFYKNPTCTANKVLGVQNPQTATNEQRNIVVTGARNSLNISPNPNQRSLNILVPVFMQGRIEISNLKGELLKTIRFRGAEVAIDLDFPEGAYLLKAISQNGKSIGESGFSLE